MKIDTFRLERYLGKYEFKAPNILCTSDCQSLTAGELLEICGESEDSYKNVWLGYTETKGSPDLRKAISALYTSVKPDEILTFSGAEEGIFIFMNAALNPDDHIIVLYPAYQSLHEIAKAAGCSVSFWEMDEKNDWKPDLNELKKLIQKNTAAIILNSPHNPTGFNFSKEDFSEIVKIASDNSLYLFSDEVYRELEYQKSDRLTAAADCYSKGVSLGVMSKAYGLAGIRIGWIASKDSALMQKLSKLKDYISICQSAPSEYLAEIALLNREKLLAKNLKIISDNLELLDSFFEKYTDILEWVRPNCGPIGYVRIKSEEDAESFCLDAVEKAGILLLPSTVFSDDNTHFRIGFGRYDMKKSLLKFEEFLKDRYNL
ncbi:MAG: aminotransferase class I/II-fold pyridoxal phosphate-dependent enzyme [Methanomicrobium sp.]|nr:aminotransferase class I/II-fold pyridoxal phosphate-dependent enzyme [Methanomicrobium sp.]